jgi:endonuclease YncB( thermonuclease family)
VKEEAKVESLFPSLYTSAGSKDANRGDKCGVARTVTRTQNQRIRTSGRITFMKMNDMLGGGKKWCELTKGIEGFQSEGLPKPFTEESEEDAAGFLGEERFQLAPVTEPCVTQKTPLGVPFRFLPAPFQTVNFTGVEIIGFSDGDCFRARKNGKEVYIRLAGVDCPETGQEYGQEALNYLRLKLEGQRVFFKFWGWDANRRAVGEVTVEGPRGGTGNAKSVNTEIVKDGFAWWFWRFSVNRGDLKKAHMNAKHRGLGLWRNPNAIPPWDWRNKENRLVLRTRNGKCYHREGCEVHLKLSNPQGHVFQLHRFEAEKTGLKPCCFCTPDTDNPGPVPFDNRRR